MSGRVSEKAPFNLFFLCQGIILLSFAQEIAQKENPEGKDGKNPWGAKYDVVFDAVFGGFRGREGWAKREIMGLVLVSPVCCAVSSGRVRDWAGR